MPSLEFVFLFNHYHKQNQIRNEKKKTMKILILLNLKFQKTKIFMQIFNKRGNKHKKCHTQIQF